MRTEQYFTSGRQCGSKLFCGVYVERRYLLQKLASLVVSAFLFASFNAVGKAGADSKKLNLNSDECLEVLSAIVSSERVEYGQEYPLLYEVRGSELEVLLKYPSVWLYDEPRAGTHRRLAVEVLGFRTAGLEHLMCAVDMSDKELRPCMFGIARETHSEGSSSVGLLTSVEAISVERCEPLFEHMQMKGLRKASNRSYSNVPATSGSNRSSDGYSQAFLFATTLQ